MAKTLQEWKDTEFLPWKAKMETYMAERSTQAAIVRKSVPQLQAMVAMLMEGRTKQAVLAWNTLELHPKLKDIRLGADGETLTLVATDGTPQVLKLDTILAELDKMVGR